MQWNAQLSISASQPPAINNTQPIIMTAGHCMITVAQGEVRRFNLIEPNQEPISPQY